MHNTKNIGLEVKASNKSFKGCEGHNGHSGWHIIICYRLLINGDIEFTHAHIAELIGFEYPDSDWRYQGSKRYSNNSQRTEICVTSNIGTAKLRDGSIYLNPEFAKITPALLNYRKKIESILPIPSFPPFAVHQLS